LSTNWLQSIFEFGLRKFCSFNRKNSLFSKKREKMAKFRGERKKKQFQKKSSSTQFLHISIGRINVQKISQIGDGHWSLGLKGLALKGENSSVKPSTRSYYD
jgi:hypothetical protein